MLFITIIGCIALFIIQFVLYAKQGTCDFLLFMASEQWISVLKEFLIIVLGAVVALNTTSYYEKRKTKKTVIKLLEAAKNDMHSQYLHNNSFEKLHNEDRTSNALLKHNAMIHLDIIENILNNDVVVTTISPTIYSLLFSEIRNLNTFYGTLKSLDAQSENVIIMLKSMNSHQKAIVWELEVEIERLKGKISYKDATRKCEEFIDSRFEKIEIKDINLK